MARDTPTDFETLARQYWNAWGEAMRGADVPGAPAAPPGMQAWQDSVDWWTRLAHGGRADVDAAVGRFNKQAQGWYGQMQQVAAQFAGRPASAGDIAEAWKKALGATGDNPFPEMLRGMRGQSLQGMEQWIEDASPMLEAWKREGASWLGMPAFGVAREHQQRWQALAQAQLDCQQRSNACNALMARAGQRAFELFEGRLAERGESGDKLESARALFDLWIDAAEQAYADVALSPEYRKAYGALVNAQMRLRAGVQREVEQASGQFGMPTRTEIDAAHRKIAQLERELRRLRDAVFSLLPLAGDKSAGLPICTATAARRGGHMDVTAVRARRADEGGRKRRQSPSPRPRSAPRPVPAARAFSRTRASGAQAVRLHPTGRGSKAAPSAAKRTTKNPVAKKTTKKTTSKALARKTERKPTLKKHAPARGKPAKTVKRKR